MGNYRYPLSGVPEGESELATVYIYHDRTKHHLDRYAQSLGYLDWANQPNPFRRYEGAPLLPLPLPTVETEPTYDSVLADKVPLARLDLKTISKLFFFSLALSAWKQVNRPDGRIAAQWSLRVNPSSGNLHPTEGYLICGPLPGLTSFPGIYHYAPFEHALELRRRLTGDEWRMLSPFLPAGACIVGLTSIYWRESWKYGERAFRYCQHDVGHAVGALAIAAGSLGWRTRLLEPLSTGAIEQLLGIGRQQGIEAEHGETLLLVEPDRKCIADFALPGALLESLDGGDWMGDPNRLSSDHHPWPVIDEVSKACRWAGSAGTGIAAPATRDRSTFDRGLSAHELIRQRRSAVALDGRTPIPSAIFYRILENVLPYASSIPLATLPWQPAVSLVLFVHRVSGLPEGLYVLVRHPAHLESLRHSFRPDFLWTHPEGCPPSLPLYMLSMGDERAVARTVSCGQDIAADGAFSAGMLAAFDETLLASGPGMYPRLFWESGAIGQVLYLEAEAAGIRATGIGCFHDDEVHRIVGISDRSWQSLYHFTMGGAVDDPRVQSFDAYRHLVNDRRGKNT